VTDTRPWRVLALPPLGEGLLRGMVAPLGDAVSLSLPATRDRAGLHAALPDAELVIGDFTGLLAVDAEAVAAAPHLAFVQMPSVGVDSCDVPALTKAGVPVANTAGANARSVAEWAVGAAFSLCRKLAWGDRRIRAGEWPQAALLASGVREIHTQRVGILGFGAIGAEAARLFGALGCPVSYWSRTPRTGTDATYRDLDDLLASSDLLVVALPLTPETAGLLGPARLALLPAGALLVNVARGGIVDEAALCAALDEGRLAGAALDVFDDEPPLPGSPLRTQENVLLSPHVAGATGQAQLNIVSQVVQNLTAAATGHPVKNVVNGLPAEIRRR
jgi:phosphoglycerate dehydrogenase-like enzyme